MTIYGPIYISQFGLITLCILCHQEALVSSFPPSKEENIRAWCAFPIEDMPEVVKKKVTCNNDSLIDQRVGYLLGNYSKQIHTHTHRRACKMNIFIIKGQAHFGKKVTF